MLSTQRTKQTSRLLISEKTKIEKKAFFYIQHVSDGCIAINSKF